MTTPERWLICLVLFTSMVLNVLNMRSTYRNSVRLDKLAVEVYAMRDRVGDTSITLVMPEPKKNLEMNKIKRKGK